MAVASSPRYVHGLRNRFGRKDDEFCFGQFECEVSGGDHGKMPRRQLSRNNWNKGEGSGLGSQT